MSTGPAAGVEVSSSPPGPLHGAPAEIQVSRTEISSSESLPSGGIAMLSACRTTARSRLSAALPSMTTGPESAPRISAWRLSSRRPASAIPSPWHSWHLVERSGRTRDSKNCWWRSSTVGAVSAPAGRPVPQHATTASPKPILKPILKPRARRPRVQIRAGKRVRSIGLPLKRHRVNRYYR